jgi:hypothetical protein
MGMPDVISQPLSYDFLPIFQTQNEQVVPEQATIAPVQALVCNLKSQKTKIKLLREP